MIKDGYEKLLVYVDDFLVIGDNHTECEMAWRQLRKLLKALGLPVSDKDTKLIPPTTRIKFLGIWINTDDVTGCTFTMDKEKLSKLQKTLKKMLYDDRNGIRKITTKELDSLIGSMAHLQQTVYAARGFYKNILTMRHDPSFKGKLTTGFKHDAVFWLHNIEDYDGKAILIETPQLSNDYWATDASREPSRGPIKKVGIGSFYDGQIRSVYGTPEEFLNLLLTSDN